MKSNSGHSMLSRMTFTITAFLLVGCPAMAAAAPADLDAIGFGTSGRVITTGGPRTTWTDGARALAIQTDGKIVAVGTGQIQDRADPDNQPTGALIVRYNPDGSLDPTFGFGDGAGGDGIVLAPADFNNDWADLVPPPFPGISGVWEPTAVVIQSDGKIVVAGGGTFGLSLTDTSGVIVARFLPDGRLDRSFGNFDFLAFDDAQAPVYPGFDRTSMLNRGGMVVIARYCQSVAGLVVQADGKIVVVGDCDATLARLNANGTPDRPFGGGSGRFDPLDTTGLTTGGLALQADGRLVVAGASLLGTFTVARVTAAGQIDGAFGAGSGRVATQIGLSGDAAADAGPRAVLLQPDGKILVVGVVRLVAPRPSIGLARYNADGSLDVDFGVNGTATTDFGDWTEARAAALQPDGKIVVAGLRIANGSACERQFVARYNSDGSVDDTFGTNGRVVTDFDALTGPGCNVIAEGVGIQADGKIVTAGSAATGGSVTPTTAGYIAVARYLGGAGAGNTPAGANVAVQLNAVALTFQTVTQAGNTTVTTSATGPLPPTGFQLGDPARYFDITTTATFAGFVEVCVSYTGIAFGNENNVRLLHFASSGVVDVTTSLDTAADVVCGRTTELSPFAVVETNAPALIVALIEAIRGRAFPTTVEARLVSALTTALANQGSVSLACRLLDTFVALVRSAAARGQIDQPQATQLIGQAQAVKRALGC